MTSEQVSQLDVVLAAVKEQFQHTLTYRILEIEKLMIEIDKGEPAAPRLAAISDMAHKTAGVASTIGHVKLGSIASKIDAKIGRIGTGNNTAVDWATFRPKLSDFLDKMEESLDVD